MPKLLLLFVLACIQFSSQEELKEIKEELISDEIFLPEKEIEVLDGADQENWTEDDEKWLQEFQPPLKESDEDYDEEFERLEKLIEEIEHYFRKNNPKYGHYDWLYQLAKWFGGDDDTFDYSNEEENLDVTVDDKDDIDLYYSWLHKIGKSLNKAQSLKKFTSV